MKAAEHVILRLLESLRHLRADFLPPGDGLGEETPGHIEIGGIEDGPELPVQILLPPLVSASVVKVTKSAE